MPPPKVQPTPSQEMAAYDRLPKTLRQALRNSGEQFSASQLFELWHLGHMSCRELIKLVQQEDRAR